MSKLASKVVVNSETGLVERIELTGEEIAERENTAIEAAEDTALVVDRESKLNLGVADIQNIFSETWFQSKLKGKHYANVGDISANIQTDFGFTSQQANFLARIMLGLYATWLILYDVREILDPYEEG